MSTKAGFAQRLKVKLGLTSSMNFSCLQCGNIFSVVKDNIPASVLEGDEKVLCPRCGKPAKKSVVQCAEDLKHL